ncbi:MAG: hypothetical protein JJU15_00990 [Pararhodobacter sp.]|nr:hypothetical protein [Pararhodobacter sp.]
MPRNPMLLRPGFRGVAALFCVMLTGVACAGGPAQSQTAPGSAVTEPTASVELVFWQSIMQSTSPDEFRAYLERWPDGIFADLARLRLAALSSPPPPMMPPEGEWSPYVNARFGTSLRFPANQFVAQPPPDNDDGRSFLTPDGTAGFLVFGQHDMFGQSPDVALDAALRDGEYDQVRLQRVLPGEYEFTALQGSRLLHRRVLIDRAQGLIHVFEGFYPLAREAEFAALMERIALSLEGASAPAPTIEPSPQTAFPPVPPSHPSVFQSPARDTALRRDLMDAARVPVQADLGRPLLFVVNTLRTAGDWAFLMGTPVEPDGRRFDWMRTPFARDWQADMMSDLVMVLLVRQGGQWRALEYVIGPTDVYWIDWVQTYGLPEALFYAP